MEVRIRNNKTETIRVVLEPWATEFQVAPGDYICFRSAQPIPGGGYFQIDQNDSGILVWAEWDRALVHAYSVDGQLID